MITLDNSKMKKMPMISGITT